MAESTNPSDRDLVARPEGHLHHLPIDVRWQVTRRHPYYLAFWELARRYYRESPTDDAEEMLNRFVAQYVLALIGVTAEPVDPRTQDLTALDSDPNPAFLTGSVLPVTMRGMIHTLIAHLPPLDLVTLATVAFTAVCKEHEEPGDDHLRTYQREIAHGILAWPVPPWTHARPSPCFMCTLRRPAGQSKGT